MKATIILLVVSFCLSTAYSQDTQAGNRNEKISTGQSQAKYNRHRIHIYYGIGYANSIYDQTDNAYMYPDYSLSSSFELKYAYFFAREWGVSAGAGISAFAARGTLNMEGTIPHYHDPSFDPAGQRYYDLLYKFNNLKEQQRIWALETPVQFHYEHFIGEKHGVFASLGAKGYFPVISAQSKFLHGKESVTLTGYEAYTNTLYTDPPHFGKMDARDTPVSAKLNFTVDAVGELGGIYRLSNVCDFYAGFYYSYNFMDALPEKAGKKDIITPEYNKTCVVNSLLTSNILNEYNAYIKSNHLDWKEADEKWTRWQIGVKIGIHFVMKH